MYSTTLITFLLQVHPSVTTVELLGSWDQFARPYPLERDRQAGRGHWRGCHNFRNITCDGDTLVGLTSRDGGLRMGGTYWYYYRLDGELEYHDPGEPSTTSCRLLPGQRVNILQVPVEVKNRSSASDCSAKSALFTMDPQDKYRHQGHSLHEPPGKVCHPLASKVSLGSFSGYLSSFVRKRTDFEEKSPRPMRWKCRSTQSLSRHPSVSSGVRKERASNSAGDDSIYANSLAQVEQQVLNSGSEARCFLTESTMTTRANPGSNRHAPHDTRGLGSTTYVRRSTGLHVPPNTPDQLADVRKDGNFPRDQAGDNAGSYPTEASISTDRRGHRYVEALEYPIDALELGYVSAHSTSTNVINDLCSLTFGPNTTTRTDSFSPRHFSQTSSPNISHLGKDAPWVYDGISRQSSQPMDYPFAHRYIDEENIHRQYASPTATMPYLEFNEDPDRNTAFSGLQAYELPQTEFSSTLTLKQQPSTLCKPIGFTPLHQKGSQGHVRPWNDGSQDHMTALLELLDDHGYLGEVIG